MRNQALLYKVNAARKVDKNQCINWFPNNNA